VAGDGFGSAIIDPIMKKTASLIAISALLALTLPALHAEQPAPAGLSAGDWSGIRAAHEDWRHRFEKTADGSHAASNPGQDWTTRFDGRGFLVEPAGETWRWGLELRSYGVGESRATVAEKAAVAVSDKKLSYRWDGRLEEWFLNDTRGIEQGWTFSERPSGSDNERLTLELAVRGGLQPRVNASGLCVSFADARGIALTYGGLKAWDATGRDLPVRFLENGAGKIAIEVDERAAVYPVTIDPVAQQARLKAENAETGDSFGSAVAISGDTVVVGAPHEGGFDNNLPNSGAVYVFVRNGSGWTQQAYLRAFNAGAEDLFGTAVALSGDLLVIGAPREDATVAGDAFNNSLPDSGAIYVYTRSGSTWTIQARLKAPNGGENDYFGSSVAVSGGLVIAGAPYEDNGSNSIAMDNNLQVNAGSVYVYAPSGMTWTFQTYLKASTTDGGDRFGSALAVSGETLAVGAPEDGGRGRCVVFTHSGGTWSEQAVLEGSNSQPNDEFGFAVALSGDTLVVGAPAEDTGSNGQIADASDNIGAAYVFVRNAAAWTQQAILKASNARRKDRFGEAVAVSGNFAAIAAPYEDTAASGSLDTLGPGNFGAVYVYRRSGARWVQRPIVKGSSTAAGGNFGFALAMEGATLLSGAPGEDSNAGAAYIFTLTEVAPTLSIRGKKTIRVQSRTARHPVRGTAADLDGNLARVEVKDTRPKGRKTFRRATGKANWSYRAPLRKGRNLIQAVAVDSDGNRSKTARITVIRGRK
jgi:hypothetical protein